MQRVLVDDDRRERDAAVTRRGGRAAPGGVVAFPTDTLYGLAVDPRSRRGGGAAVRIERARRTAAVPLIAATSSRRSLGWDVLGPRERRIADAFWPGPLSIVIPASAAIARGVLGGGSYRRDSRAGPRAWRAQLAARVRLLHHGDEREPDRAATAQHRRTLSLSALPRR